MNGLFFFLSAPLRKACAVTSPLSVQEMAAVVQLLEQAGDDFRSLMASVAQQKQFEAALKFDGGSGALAWREFFFT